MLESYITPLLFGYVNKYVKNLKASDLNLSLWGGDVVLNNLELNLEVLHREINLPIKFSSGKIAELRIHVPWTRLSTQSVVVTINTIEFVLTLTDPDDDNEEKTQDSLNGDSSSLELAKVKQLPKDNRDLPPGYVQGLLNKIMNNIQIKVNNVIIKYVEDDIVLSLNTRSAELFTTDKDWNPSFIDVGFPDLVLRRVGCINDLTVCLDQRNSNGMIEMYQDPVLFRCSFVCRLLSRYSSPNTSKPSLTVASIHCETFDFSFTDQQLPLYNRLVSLLLNFYYGDLDLPGAHQKMHSAKRFLGKQHTPAKGKTSPVLFPSTPENEYNDDGWFNWALSFVPPLSDEDQNYDSSSSNDPLTPSLVFAGFYCSQVSVTIKITSKSADDSLLGIKRFEFVPVVNVELSGVKMEMVIEGDLHFDMHAAVTSIVGYKIGECLCRSINATVDRDNDKQSEDEMFLTIDNMSNSHASTAFLDKSLFCVDTEELYVGGDYYGVLKRPYDDQSGAASFAAVYFNYHYELMLSNSESSSDLISDHRLSFNELSQKRVVLGPSIINVSSGVYHLVETVHKHFVKDQKERQMRRNFELDSFALHQLRQGAFQTRGTNITINSLKLNILMADHARGQKEKPDQDVIFTVAINRIDALLTQPMYSTEIKSLLSSNPSSSIAEIKRNAVTKAYLKVFGFNCGFSLRNLSDKSYGFKNADNLSASFFRKTNMCNSSSSKTTNNEVQSELRIESPNFTLKFSKCQLFLLAGFIQSWYSPLERLSWSPLVDYIIRVESEHHVLMNLGLVDLNVCSSILEKGLSFNVHVNGIHGYISRKDGYKNPFIYGPLETKSVSSVSTILSAIVPDEFNLLPDEPLLSVACQLMHYGNEQLTGKCSLNVVSIRLRGIVICVDENFIQWFLCGPSETMVNLCTSEKRHQPKYKPQSSRAISTSTPKRRSYSRLYSIQPSSGYDSNPPNEGVHFKRPGSDKPANDEREQFKSTPFNFLAWLESFSGTVITDNIVLLFSNGKLLNPTKEDDVTIGGTKPNILQELKAKFHLDKKSYPPSLLLCLPELHISSSNALQIPPLDDLPLSSSELDLIPLPPTPWRGSLSNLSIFVLPEGISSSDRPQQSHFLSLVSPFSLEFCIASSKTLQGSQNNKNIFDGKQLGLVIHVNCNAIALQFSPSQACIVINVSKAVNNALECVTNDIKKLYYLKTRQLLQPTSLSFDEEQSEQLPSDRLSSSSTSTTNLIDDGTIASTERNTTFSNVTEHEAASKAMINVAVSLFLQATIPKICLAFTGSDPDKGSTVICLDEVTTSFDYQDGGIEAATKIDSTNVFFLETEWLLDPVKMDSPPVDCLIACSSDCENKSPCFLSIKYTKSNGNCAKKMINGKWQSTLIEDLIYQSKSTGKLLIIEDTALSHHHCSLSIQSLDILVLPQTVNSMVDILSFFTSNQKRHQPVIARPPVDNHTLGMPTRTVMHLLPSIDLSWNGCRILIPKMGVDSSRPSCKSSHDNVCALQVQCLSVTSNPENQISQSVLHEEWFGCTKRFAKAKHYQDNIELHKQYQVVVQGLSMWTGKYSTAEAKSLFKLLTTQLQYTNPNLQNPALDWNKMTANSYEPNDVSWSQIIDSFGFRVTVAPAMKLTTKPNVKEIIVTSHSLELVLLDDIICKANNKQVGFIVGLVADLKKMSQSATNCDSPASLNGSHSSRPIRQNRNYAKIPTHVNLQENEFAIGGHSLANRKSDDGYFELFVSGKKLSFSLYNVSEAQCDRLLLPLVMVCIMQPTLHYSYVHPLPPKMTASIFTMTVSGSSVVSPTFDLLSSDECFDVAIMQTMHQHCDPVTGLLPHAVTITVEGSSLNTISIEVSHFVNVNLPLAWLNQIVPIIVTLLGNFTEAETAQTKHVSNPLFNGPASTSSRKLTIHGTQISICVYHSVAVIYPQLDVRIGPKISGTLIKKFGSDNMLYWNSSVVIDIDSVSLLIIEQTKMHMIMSPSFFQLRWYHNVWNNITRDIICVDNETLKFRVGSKSLLLLKQICDGFESVQAKQTPKDVAPSHLHDNHLAKSHVHVICQVYVDDLRGGSLSYVIAQDKHDQRARPNQILFSNDATSHTRWMTWHYREPRILTECIVMPLPFNIDETRIEDENLLIPCLLQYWSDADQSFVDYQEFSLSEISACKLCCDSVDSSPETFSTAVVAEEWRVIVDYAKMSASMGGMLPYIPIASTSLAACMKLTSCYQPHRIPVVAIALSSQSLNIDIAMDISIDTWGPPILSPFFLDIDTYPLEQELININLSPLNANGFLWPNATLAASAQLDISVFAMNYGYLMWQQILNTSNTCLTMNQWVNEQGSQASSASLHFGPVTTSLSPAIVNTLSLAMNHWTAKNDNSKSPMVIPHHIIICNDTQETILFGQATTAEEIHLASGQLYPYNWHCSKKNEKMWLAIDSCDAVSWSSPFSIDHAGMQVIKVTVNQLQCDVLVEVINVTGIQRQIVIKGSYSLSNCTDCVLEFLITQSAHHVSMRGRPSFCNLQEQFVVQNNVTRPSLVLDATSVKCLSLRIGNETEKNMRSIEIQIPANSEIVGSETTHAVELSGENGISCYWVAFTAFSKKDDVCNQQWAHVIITVCPMFVMRNHLHCPITMSVRDRNSSNQQCTMIVEGQGNETEISSLTSSQWYHVTFQLPGDTAWSSPPVPMNSSLVSLIETHQTDDVYQSINHADAWPYFNLFSLIESNPKGGERRSYATSLSHTIVTQSQDDSEDRHQSSHMKFKCDFVRKWKTLPTIILELKPLLLIRNDAGSNVYITAGANKVMSRIEKGMTLSPEAVTEVFKVGINHPCTGDVIHWSDPTKLQSLQDSQQPLYAQTGKLLPDDSTTCNIVITSGNLNVCIQLSLCSKMCFGVRVICVKERFSVHNRTHLPLLCYPILAEICPNKLQHVGFESVELTEKDTSHISGLSIIQGKQSSNQMEVKPMTQQQLSKYSMSFYFSAYRANSCLLPGLHLSCEHLREVIDLTDESGTTHAIAMTSSQFEGVIHIYVTLDSKPFFTINNNCHLLGVLNMCKTKSDVYPTYKPIESIESIGMSIPPLGTQHWLPEIIKERFPRLDAVPEYRIQIGLVSVHNEGGDVVHFSDPFSLSGKIAFDIKVDDSSYAISCNQQTNSFVLSIDHKEDGSAHSDWKLDPLLQSSLKFKVDADDVIVIICTEKQVSCSVPIASIGLLACAIDYVKMDQSMSKLEIEVGSIQIDNRLDNSAFDFPVIFSPLQQHIPLSSKDDIANTSIPCPKQSDHNRHFFSAIDLRYNDSGTVLERLTATISPSELYLEDMFWSRLCEIAPRFVPYVQSTTIDKRDQALNEIHKTAAMILNPLNLGEIVINDINLLLSVHASVKVYLSTDHMPLVLGKYTCNPSLTVQSELFRSLMYHYATQVLVRAGWMLGSFEIIGNPTGFLNNIGRGISDFVAMPYNGLIRGPTSFVSGIGMGVSSLVRHLSTGTILSMSDFASSMSRNLDRLSLDQQHVEQQQVLRSGQVTGPLSGFGRSLSGLGVSLLGAVGGIVDHPMRNVQNAENLSGAMTGLISGLGIGMMGVLTKPIGGAMEIVSQTGQGVLHGAGLLKIPQSLQLDDRKTKALVMKHSGLGMSWSVLRCFHLPIVFLAESVRILSDANKACYNGIIALNVECLYICSTDSLNIMHIINNCQISMEIKVADKSGHSILTLTPIDSKETEQTAKWAPITLEMETIVARDLITNIISVCWN